MYQVTCTGADAARETQLYVDKASGDAHPVGSELYPSRKDTEGEAVAFHSLPWAHSFRTMSLFS